MAYQYFIDILYRMPSMHNDKGVMELTPSDGKDVTVRIDAADVLRVLVLISE